MKPAFLSVLIAFVLFLTAASKNPSPSQHKSEATRAEKGVQQQQLQVPLSVWQSTETTLSEAIRTIQAQAVAAEKQAEAYKETYSSPAVRVNIALAAVGFGYLVFACLQWMAIREQGMAIKEQARIANDALIETRKAAEAASDSARFARESFENAQRASISIEDVELYPLGPGSPGIEYQLRNTGGVPATGVVEGCGAAKGDGKRPDPRYVQKGRIGAGDTSLIDNVIAPGEVTKRSYSFGISSHPDLPPLVTDEDILAASESRRYIMFYIQVAYWDGFGKERMSAKYFLLTEGGRIEPYGGKHE